MRYDIEVNGTARQVTVERRAGRLLVTTGDHAWLVDPAAIGGQTLSLLVEQVRPQPDSTAGIRSHEIAIASDPLSGRSMVTIAHVSVLAGPRARRWGSRDEAAGGSGPQRIAAPMPGKIVRVLAQPGDIVKARQAVVVIEAMKMENELRAASGGTVAELLVHEGQLVEAGTLLAVVAPD